MQKRRSRCSHDTATSADALVGRRVLAVVDLAPRRIVPFLPEVLVLGLPEADGGVLIAPDRPVPDGGRLA